MATNIYAATAINGGGTGAMDSIVYATLNDGDICITADSSEDYAIFRFESSSSTAESSPWTTNKVVKPDDAGANNGRWVLCDTLHDDVTAYGDLTVTGTLTLSGSLSTTGFSSTGDITMGDSTLISFDDILPSGDHAIVGISGAWTAGENLVFGDFCYLKSDGKMWKADADAATTMPCLAMAAATINADASGDFLMWGWARDDTWGWTVGNMLYASTTAGALTATAPTGNNDIVQAVAVATHADRIYFQPALTLVKVTA